MKIRFPGGVIREIQLQQGKGGTVQAIPTGEDYLAKEAKNVKPAPVPIETLAGGRLVLAKEWDLKLLSGINHGLIIRPGFMATDRYLKIPLDERGLFWKDADPRIVISHSTGTYFQGLGPLPVEELLMRYNADDAPAASPPTSQPSTADHALASSSRRAKSQRGKAPKRKSGKASKTKTSRPIRNRLGRNRHPRS